MPADDLPAGAATAAAADATTEQPADPGPEQQPRKRNMPAAAEESAGGDDDKEDDKDEYKNKRRISKRSKKISTKERFKPGQQVIARGAEGGPHSWPRIAQPAKGQVGAVAKLEHEKISSEGLPHTQF